MKKQIKYIENKKIDYKLLENILSKSHKDSHFTNNGPAKKQLEKKLEQLLEIDKNKKIICTANGTLALHAIFLFLLNKNKNLKFVSPSFTFPSCLVGGFKTDLIDIDLKTFTIPLTDNIMKNYDVFVITNLFGTFPKNIETWISKSKSNQKTLIFDNASSPMTKIKGKNINNYGDFSFGSLHHTKFLGFGEGGFIVIPKELYGEFEQILGFGYIAKSKDRRFSQYSSNFKISDISSAAILQHIENYNLDNHIINQNSFINKIKNVKQIQLFNYEKGVVYGSLPIIYNKKIDIDFFRKNKIEANKYYYPLENHKNTQHLFDRIINFPINSSLKEEEIEYIVEKIKESLK